MGQAETILLLLSKGATIDIEDEVGNTALMKAIKNRHYKIFSFLLSMGANYNTINKRGMTPFLSVVKAANFDLFNLLLSLDVDLYSETNAVFDSRQQPIASAALFFLATGQVGAMEFEMAEILLSSIPTEKRQYIYDGCKQRFQKSWVHRLTFLNQVWQSVTGSIVNNSPKESTPSTAAGFFGARQQHARVMSAIHTAQENNAGTHIQSLLTPMIPICMNVHNHPICHAISMYASKKMGGRNKRDLEFTIKVIEKFDLFINTPNLQGWTPISMAIILNELDIVNALLDKYPDLYLRQVDSIGVSNTSLFSAIIRCIYLENFELIKALHKRAPLQPREHTLNVLPRIYQECSYLGIGECRLFFPKGSSPVEIAAILGKNTLVDFFLGQLTEEARQHAVKMSTVLLKENSPALRRVLNAHVQMIEPQSEEVVVVVVVADEQQNTLN